MNDIKGKTETATDDSELREKFRLEAIAIIERYLNTLEIEKKTVENNMNKKKDELDIFLKALDH